jgi:hypothetical protein
MDALRNPHKQRPPGEWTGGLIAQRYESPPPRCFAKDLDEAPGLDSGKMLSRSPPRSVKDASSGPSTATRKL